MLYGFSELIKYLSLGPGPFEQPGTDSPESAVGADNDQNEPTFYNGSTSMKLTAPQNPTERLSKDLKKAARLSMIAGQQAVDDCFQAPVGAWIWGLAHWLIGGYRAWHACQVLHAPYAHAAVGRVEK